MSAGVGLGDGPVVNGRGLAAADYDNDGDLDVAVDSIGGPLVLLRNSGAAGHWLEVQLRTFAPGAQVTAVLPGGRGSSGGSGRGELPVLGGSARALRPRGATKLRALIVRYPTGREVRLTNVAVDRLVPVGPG